MNLVKSLAIFFFDLLDIYYHQKKIIKYFLRNKIDIKLFCDIGSHKGTYTDLFIKNFKNSKVLMFEPQTKIFYFIKKKYKNKNNVKCFNIAISDDQSKKLLSINEHDLTSSFSTFNKKNNYLKVKAILFGKSLKKMINKKVIVKTSTLDEIIKTKKIFKIDLVKIDTEGHELQVLKGMKKSLKKINHIMVEIHNDEIYQNYNPKKVHNFLIRNNYELKDKFRFPFTTWEDRIYTRKAR
jgi:FkbM family methyltransferase